MTAAQPLTFAQRRALCELRWATRSRTANSIFTRSDVLWRLEERGLVTRNIHDEWQITRAGEDAYTEAMARRGGVR